MKRTVTLLLSAALLCALVALGLYYYRPQPAATGEEVIRVGGAMKSTLSKRLSPEAKKAILRSSEDAVITGLLQVAPNANLEILMQTLTKLGVTYGTWNSQTHQLRIDAPAGQLNAVAELKEVIYFEMATRYTH